MDTNQNNQLLHTFEKGMDTDTSDAWLESGKYRYALNLRYLTDIGNDTGELHSIEGWVSTDINSFNVSPYPAGAFKSYGEPVQYGEYCTEGSPKLYYMKTAPGIEEFDVQGRTFGHGNLCCYQGIVYVCIVEEGEIASDQFNSDEWDSVHLDDLVNMGYMDYKGYDAGSTILAATSIRDLGIYVVKDIFNRWFVFKQQKDDQSTTKVFGPCIESIGDGYKNKLSLVTRWEDDDNIKLYIADGEHELMVINIADPTRYTNIQDITNTNSVALSRPQIKEIIAGSLKPAIIQYSYRLYKRNQTASSVSPVSQPVIIDQTKSGVTYGIKQGKHSSRGVRLEIALPSTLNKYNKITVYRITYEINGQNPTIDIIYDSDLSLNDGKFILDDPGLPTISTVSTAEYNSYDGIDIIPSIIESKDDYLFASNIQYVLTEDFRDWDARSYTSGNYFDRDGERVSIFGSFNDLSEVPTDVTIKHLNWSLSSEYNDEWWEDKDYHVGRGTGVNIDWKFIITQKLLDYNIDRAGVHETNTNIIRSLQRGELYRYAIVLYSKDGYKSEAKWITDIRVPNQSAEVESLPDRQDYDTDEDYNNAVTLYRIRTPFEMIVRQSVFSQSDLYGNSVGVEFTVRNLPQDCIGYEIVRCKRTIDDRYSITQGVVSRTISPCETEDYDITFYNPYTQRTDHATVPLKSDSNQYNHRIPTGFITFDSMWYGRFFNYMENGELTLNEFEDLNSKAGLKNVGSDNFKKGLNDELLFFSPEVAYQGDDLNNVVSEYSAKIKPLLWISPACMMHPEDDYINPSCGQTRQSFNLGGFFRIINLSSIQGHSFDDVYHAGLYYDTESTYTLTFDNGNTQTQAHIYSINAGKTTNEINTTFIKSKEAYSPIFYVKLYNKNEGITISQDESAISSTKMMNSRKYNEFADENENISILDHVVPMSNGRNVIQWTSPLIYKQEQLSTSSANVKNQFKNFATNKTFCCAPIGISGKAMLMKQDIDSNDTTSLFYNYETNIDKPITTQPGDEGRSYSTMFGTFICNITKATVPYGGQENSAKTNNIYISYGNYHTSSNATAEVYDGDCNLECFECTTVHNWYHPTLVGHMNMNVVYSIPLETLIDIDRDYGDRYSKLNANSGEINRDLNFLQTDPTDFRGWFVQAKPMYQYNTAYSVQPDISQYTGMSKEDAEDNKYDYRTYYSQQKTNNEQIDSWTLFKSANYLDVDTRYGEITNLRLFKDRLLFWLNEAVGVLSVNERTILQDLNDYNIILGNGDVLQRYDYITTEYGMKPDQYADGQSNTCLYWWDGYKNEILAYAGEGVVPTGRTNSIHSYLCDAAIEENNPTLAYDDKYNEMLFSLNNYQSLVFNEVIKAYTGIYTIAFKNKVNFVDKLLLCDYDDKVNIWNQHHNNEDYMPSMLLYVVNANPTYTKVYDDMLFECTPDPYGDTDSPKLEFEFNTPLKLRGKINEVTSTNCSKRERDFRMRIPRAEIYEESVWKEATVGERLRGKTMKCKLTSTTKKQPLSLQYIITKFRISWS